MNYLVIFEKNASGKYFAYVPDLETCFSYGETFEDAKQNIKEAIELHLEGMKEEGMIIPIPYEKFADFVSVAA